MYAQVRPEYLKECVAEPCSPLAENPRMKILAFCDGIRHFEFIGLTSNTSFVSRLDNIMDLE
jgi:hypothetical protein